MKIGAPPVPLSVRRRPAVKRGGIVAGVPARYDFDPVFQGAGYSRGFMAEKSLVLRMRSKQRAAPA